MLVERYGKFGLSFDKIFGGESTKIGSKTVTFSDTKALIGLNIDLNTLGILTFDGVKNTHVGGERQSDALVSVSTIGFSWYNDGEADVVNVSIVQVIGTVFATIEVISTTIVGDKAYVVVEYDFANVVGEGNDPLNNVTINAYATNGITGNVA